MPERRIEYQTVQQTADSGFVITAPSLQRLYIDAALSLTDQMVQLDLLGTPEKRTLSVSAENRTALMAKWLTEILTLFQKDKILCKRIVFNTFDGKSITATIFGEPYQPVKHGSVPEFKVNEGQLQIGDQQNPEPQFFAKIFLSRKVSTK